MRAIVINIEKDLLRRIDRAANKTAGAPMNRSQFIREAVREYLVRMDTSTEELRETDIFRRNRTRLHREAVALIDEQAKT